ncbi:MAG: hypothetical protein DDT23_00986 [candidate division WS2 bacterium]|nr:hypothetical protein [Candidatus Lithacetigena glycinireducens]
MTIKRSDLDLESKGLVGQVMLEILNHPRKIYSTDEDYLVGIEEVASRIIDSIRAERGGEEEIKWLKEENEKLRYIISQVLMHLILTQNLITSEYKGDKKA